MRRVGSVSLGSIGLLGALASLAACSSSSSPGAPGAGAGGDAAADDGPPACLPTSVCNQAPAPGQQCVTTMSATMVDPAGAPVAGLPVFVCGTNLCSEPSRTAADGTVTLAACLPFASPALKVFSDPQWAAFAALLSGAGPSFGVGPITVQPLPAAGVAFPTGQPASMTSGGVTLAVQPGSYAFDVTHPTPDAQKFRSAPVPPAALPGSLAGQVDAAWALAPLDTRLAPAGQLTLPNTPGWPAGSKVDLYLNGTDTTTETPLAPWGAWGLVGTSTVSADGQTMTFPLAEIAMVGVKLHP